MPKRVNRSEGLARTVLKKVGFFTDRESNDGCCLRSAPRGHVTERGVIDYLNNGTMFIMSPGPVRDLLEPSRGFAGTQSILTDGVWAWQDCTVYYVEQYGIRLPDEFVDYVRSKGGVLPAHLTNAELMLLKV